MKAVSCWVAIALLVSVSAGAQGTKRQPPTKKPVPAQALTRADAQVRCPSALGTGVKTRQQFCDVLTGRDPKEGVLVTIPPHGGAVTLTFALHNRHTYSEELIKAKRAFRQYTATIGVLTMDNTLIERAVIQSEFRRADDLFDRVEGGAAPGGVKAVAPLGAELITMELPEDVGTEVSILGETLRVTRPDGQDNFITPGRPIATISAVRLEYRPAPARNTPAKRP